MITLVRGAVGNLSKSSKIQAAWIGNYYSIVPSTRRFFFPPAALGRGDKTRPDTENSEPTSREDRQPFYAA